jgi:hypothetical protein
MFKSILHQRVLIRIEKAIDKTYPIGHTPMISTIISYGLYLGEVFIRNNPEAARGVYKENIMEIEFRINKGERSFIGYPMKRIQNYWIDRSLALTTYYQMNMDVLEGRITPELSDEWKDHNGQYQYRFPANIKVDAEFPESEK